MEEGRGIEHGGVMEEGRGVEHGGVMRKEEGLNTEGSWRKEEGLKSKHCNEVKVHVLHRFCPCDDQACLCY